MTRRISSLLRVVAASVAVGVLGFLGTAVYFGSLLAQPVPQSAGPIPEHPPLQAVSFASKSGSTLQGWFGRQGGRSGGIVLLHGVRGNRTSMLGRARFLYEAGYSVLMFDFQAHGESDGDRITFGFLEALDARAAVGFLRQQLPDEPIAAIGTSLGGAACVLGSEPIEVEALVIEAVYPHVHKAIKNRLRLRFGHAGDWLAPLFTFQLPLRTGIDLADLRPAANISRIRAPILIVAGEQDQRTTLADSRQLFRAAPEPKQLWRVPGARHVDFHRYASSEYEERVLEFLQTYLRGPI